MFDDLEGRNHIDGQIVDVLDRGLERLEPATATGCRQIGRQS